MSANPDDYRAESRDRWEQSAAGWERRREEFQRMARPLSQWMVEAIAPQPGHRVLELAAGLGDTGLLAAELVRPGGEVLITDGAEAMVAAAARNAEAAGADNVETRVMEAEWIDLPTASTDGVLCRFGYMLLADPETALRVASFFAGAELPASDDLVKETVCELANQVTGNAVTTLNDQGFHFRVHPPALQLHVRPGVRLAY